jgi:hypothetical protein
MVNRLLNELRLFRSMTYSNMMRFALQHRRGAVRRIRRRAMTIDAKNGG